MPDQAITDAARQVIWEVHGRKCFYCREALALVEAEVDHVLPQHLATDYGTLKEILKEAGLPFDFNIFGFENLAPACGRCNRDKSGRILPSGALGIHLAKLHDVVPKIIQEIDRRRGERRLESMLLTIARGVGADKFTWDDVHRATVQIQNRFPDGIRGAKPSSRPESPEIMQLHTTISARSSLAFTAHARERMLERNISASQLAAWVFASSNTRESFAAKTSDKDSFQLIGYAGLTLTFAVDEEKVLITGIAFSGDSPDPFFS